MSDGLILRAEPRVALKKKVKKLRREGLVPAVVYGPVIETPISVSVNTRDFLRFYMKNGHSTIFSLEWDDTKQPVLIREVQVDPVTRVPLHVDFFAPNMRVVLRQSVSVVLSGLGVHDGVLQTVTTEVEVEALPNDLPHQIDADASKLVSVGDNIHASDLVLPDNVTLITSGDELIASLVAEAVEEVDEDGDDAAVAPEDEAESTEEAGEDN